MTHEQVNRILFKFEKPNYYVGGHFDYPQYTYDWNEFHRVWRKYVDTSKHTLNATDVRYAIIDNDTPLQAATRLSQIITEAKLKN